MTVTRAAVVQARTIPYDSAGAIDLVEHWAAQAESEGAMLAVFPEAFVGGYPKGSTFGAVVGQRSREGRDEYLRYFRGAIEVPGPATERLCAIAQRHHLYLVIGVIERGESTLYCTALYLSPGGELLGKRRKLMPTAAERLIWGFGDGSTMNVYDTAIGKLGAVICWENLMPAARMAMYEQGIQIYCAPTASDLDSHHATMRHIAQEGRCFVLAANQVMRVQDYPADHPRAFGDDPDALVSTGGSAIINPFGEVIAGPIHGREALLVADLDLDDIVRAKYDFDVVGHYSRPDVFELRVDRTPQRGVSFVGETAAPAAGFNVAATQDGGATPAASSHRAAVAGRAVSQASNTT